MATGLHALVLAGCSECPEGELPGICGFNLVRVGAGAGIHDAVLIDLDGDGDEELLAPGGATMVVLWGDGRIRSGDLLEELAVESLAAGDFDGDGRLDVAARSAVSPEVVFFTVDASASFTELDRVTLGGSPRGLWAGDLDGDGRDEALVVDDEDGALIVIDGADRATRSYPAGDAPIAFAVGDVDGDGALDVVTADFLGAAFVLLRGGGDGTFAAPTSIAAGVGLSEVAIGDLDGDGLVDLAGRAAAADELWIRRGADPFADAAPVRVAGDLRRGPGLAILGPEGDGGAGAGLVVSPVGDALRTWLVSADEDRPRGVRIGDDGLARSLFRAGDRWLVGGYGGAAEVEVREGLVYVERVWAPLDGETVAVVGPLIPGDFDGDGLVDVAVRGLAPSGSALSFFDDEVIDALGHRLWVHYATAAGGFVPAAPLTLDLGAHVDYVAADIDGDGRDDLVGAGGSGLWIFRASDRHEPFTIPEASSSLERSPERVVALRRATGVTVIGFTSGAPGLDRIRFDPTGEVAAIDTVFAELAISQVSAASLGDDPGESLVLLGRRGGEAAITTWNGAAPEVGPIHEVAALTGWSPELQAFELGVGSLRAEDPPEVFLSSSEGVARIRAAHTATPEVTTYDVQLTLGDGRLVIADVDGDGDRDLLRVGERVDEVVRSDGDDLEGLPERIEVAATRRLILTGDDDGPPRALAIAHDTLSDAVLEVRRVARLGRRWSLPTGGAPLIADLRGPGRPSVALVSTFGVTALLDPGADEHLDGWSCDEDEVVTAGAAFDGDGDGTDELLLALSPREASAEAIGLGRLARLRWEGDRWSEAPFPAPEGLQARGRVVLLQVRDLDGDARPELIAGHGDGVLGGYFLSVADGRGDGTFAALRSVSPFAGDQLAIGDVDGDGRRELLLSGSFGSTLLWNRGGAWTFERAADGQAAIDEAGASLLVVEDVALWRRPAVAGGRLGPRVRLADDVAPTQARTLEVGDLDGDGESDLVICGDNHQTIWLARGRHRMKRVRDLHFYHGRVALADLDGGGRLDLVFGNAIGLEWLRGEPR